MAKVRLEQDQTNTNIFVKNILIPDTRPSPNTIQSSKL